VYISQLHLQGFKSFLHKTKLEFGKGVTVVVGPNGCGKTNIVDAIRWILGEQKTSILRSSKMEDVIFNGTINRKPIGFCEASLTIHNNRGMLPIEYNDVKLTRRLFRSGESEYLLNNTPCRLKDIYELFVDTGMSSDAYSVIELRMVDSILSHNASDRRKMFEEASGINQYKKQRQSTFRKLESTQIDLDRVKDILFEVEKGVKGLKLQLKRFERHKKLSEKLESSHILLAQIEIQLIDNKMKPLSTNLNESQGKQKSMSSQTSLDEELINQVEKRYNSSKEKLNVCGVQLDEVNKNLSSVNNAILVNTEQRRNNENRIQYNNDEITRSESRLESVDNQMIEINSKIKSFIPIIEEYKQKYNDANEAFQLSENKYSTSNKELLASKEQVDSIIHKFQEKEFNLKHLKIKVSENETTIDEIDEKLVEYSEQRKHIEADVNMNRLQITNQEKETSKLNLKLEKSQLKHSKIEEKLLNKNKSLSQLKNELSSLESKHTFFNEILEINEGMSSGVKHVLENPHSFKGVAGVVSDLIETSDSYRTAIDIALGDASSYLVVDTRKNALEIISKIKKVENLQICIIPLDSLPTIAKPKSTTFKSAISCIKTKSKYDNLFCFLLGNTFVIENEKVFETLSNKELNSATWVTQNGDYFGKNHLIKSIQKQSSTSTIGRKKQIKDLEKDIQKKRESIDKTQEQIHQIEKEANSEYEICEYLSKSLDKTINEKFELEKQLSKNEVRFSQLGTTVADLKNNKKKHQLLLGEIETKILALRTEINQSKESVTFAKQKVDEITTSIQVILSNRNKLQQDMLDARVFMVEKEKEFEGLEFRLKTSQDSINEIKNRTEKFKAENIELANSIQTNVEYVKNAELKKTDFITSQNTLQNQRIELEKSVNTSYDELQDLQVGVRNRQKAKEAQMEAIQSIQLQLSEMSNEKEIIKHKIKELYHQDVPVAKLDLTEIDVDELREQTDSIDKSIDRIGPVNLAVQDEYEKEFERFNFLKDQYDDLVSSEKTLRETINKLDLEARKRFLHTFEEIRKYFKDTYTMFFEGGEAHLRLIGDEDPLDADIEIIARPSGKRAQTIRMLSAGEKALTAISLLFAIYLVKPSPFCILDEIDAPLDDSNIGKFTNVLKKFEEKTQFIVVTHNKLTMEKADYLYGVTQEEEGVSKIVSVKFKDNEELQFAS